ncbi:MAG: Gfo/Idh/MocA family protein [Hyphomicrobiaceae bacterium]
MLNAAIVGMGRWGQILVRSVLGKSDKLCFTRGVTRTVEKAETFGRETGISVSNDLGSVLNDPEIDFIVLATPHSQHGEQIKLAAAAGKHVLCEKPLTLRTQDARDAFAACAKNNVLLGVAQNRRFLPSVQKLKTMIDDGTLGTVLHFEANFSGGSGYRFEKSPDGWRANDTESPAGSMTGRGLHMTDLMIYLSSTVKTVSAFSQRRVLNIPMDDTTALLMHFEDGATGYLGSLGVTGEQWRFACYASKGWAELRGHETLAICLIGDKERTETFCDFDIERAELEAFVDAIEGRLNYPVTAEQAINNIAILEALLQSAKSGTFVSTTDF